MMAKQVLRVTIRGSGQEVAGRCVLATSLLSRMAGLLGRARFEAGEGLMIDPCKQVHMFFMPFAIDAVFVGADNRVVAIESHLKPWRLSGLHWKARKTLELPAGTCARAGLRTGDELELTPC